MPAFEVLANVNSHAQSKYLCSSAVLKSRRFRESIVLVLSETISVEYHFIHLSITLVAPYTPERWDTLVGPSPMLANVRQRQDCNVGVVRQQDPLLGLQEAPA